MEKEHNLPELPADKNSPDYVRQLDAGLEKIIGFSKEAAANMADLLQSSIMEIIHDSTEVISERRITRDEGYGNVISSVGITSGKIKGGKCLNDAINKSQENYQLKIEEAEKYMAEIRKRRGEFQGAILDLTKIDRTSQGNPAHVALYVASGDGNDVSMVMLDLLPEYNCSDVTNILLLTYSMLKAEKLKKYTPGRDIVLAYNPSRVISGDVVLSHAKKKIWEEFKNKK